MPPRSRRLPRHWCKSRFYRLVVFCSFCLERLPRYGNRRALRRGYKRNGLCTLSSRNLSANLHGFFLLVAQTTRIESYEYELPLPKITPSFFTQHCFCCCEHLYAVWMWRKASRRILCTSISTPTHLLIISCWARVLTVSLFNFVMHVHLIHTDRARKR